MQCGNNLKQLGLALQSYHATVGCFPPGALWGKGGMYDSPRTNFHVHLFPYEEQNALYDGLDKNGCLWQNANNASLLKMVLPGMLCPSDGLGGRVVSVPTRWGWAAGFGWSRLNYFGVFTGMRMSDRSSCQMVVQQSEEADAQATNNSVASTT